MSADLPIGSEGRPVSAREWAGFMSMVVGMFMAILDIQIVSASLAEIQSGLSASADEASWVQTSYLIAEIVMIPLSGWLSRLLSTRILFTISAGGFALFSALCAMAGTLPEMIVFRAAQGFIGGAMIPTVFATTYLLFPPSRRAHVSVLIGLTATLAPTIGPTVGGWLTQTFSWHWLFLINVPIGMLIAVLVWNLLDIDKPNWSLRNTFDWWGLGFLAGFLGTLEYVMEEGPRWDWLQDETVRNLSIVCAITGVLFFHRMFTRRDPLVELRAFKNTNFASGCLFSFAMGIGLYGSVYLIPLYLGRVRGFNSMQIGETMFVTGLFMFMMAPVAGKLSRYVDLRAMMAVGLLMFGTAVWLTAHMTSEWGFWEFMFPQALRGASMMFIMLPVNQIALGTLPPAMMKNASGLYNLMRNMGGAVGLALINTIVIDRGQMHRQHLAEQITWARAGVQSALSNMAAGLRPHLGGNADQAALAKVMAMMQQQALVLTYNDVLLLMSAVFFVLIPITIFLRKPGIGGGGDAH